MRRTVAVTTFEEAATEGYRQGFDEGYAAARLTVELVVKAWQKEPWAYDLEGALKALDMSRNNAEELLGTPNFTVTTVSAATPTSGQWQ